jgi:hypothetical protein
MAVSTCEEYFLIAARRCHTGAPPLVHKFTFQTAEHPHPYCLSRPRVGPSSTLRLSPRQSEGTGAPSGATIVFVCPQSLSRPRGAARRATQTSLRRLGLFAGVFLTAPGRAFRGRPKHGRPPSAKLLAGSPYWPPGGAPAPPGCVLARHARGRRILLHHQDASR